MKSNFDFVKRCFQFTTIEEFETLVVIRVVVTSFREQILWVCLTTE
jgi:hypothetical protein